MLSSSWGRATQRSTYWSGSVSTSCTSKASFSRPSIPCTHQRRNSSSKSSNPQSDDPRPLASPSEAVSKKTLPSSSPIRKRLATRLSRQRSKETLLEVPKVKQDDRHTQLPAVPSTQHLHPNGEPIFLPLKSLSNISRYSFGVLFLHTQTHFCNCIRTIKLFAGFLFLHLYTSTSHNASSCRSHLHPVVCT